jgi:hypothetical protein
VTEFRKTPEGVSGFPLYSYRFSPEKALFAMRYREKIDATHP